MPEDRRNNSDSRSEIESELFALINTVINLYNKYQNGDLKDNFFQKSIKNCMNELLKINILIKEHNILLSELLDRMIITEKYYKALDIINSISSLNFSKILYNNYNDKSKFSKSIANSMLELPGVTSQITTSFITLMDALKLGAFKDSKFIIKLFKELKISLEKFPGLELIQIKLDNIYRYVLNNNQKLVNNQNFRNLIGDDVYQVFKEFQSKINL